MWEKWPIDCSYPLAVLVHPVFHVSQLKEFRPDYSPIFADLPKPPALDATDTTPKRILDRRMVKKGGAAITQVLVKWSNLLEDSPTWEDWDVLRSRFPQVLAWGQASASPGGIVTQAAVP